MILFGNRFAGDWIQPPGLITKSPDPPPNSCCAIDGDGQMLFEDVILVYRKLRDDNLDFVKTFRAKRGDGFYRKTIYVAYNIIFNSLFPGLK